jgi:hypothetical protein
MFGRGWGMGYGGLWRPSWEGRCCCDPFCNVPPRLCLLYVYLMWCHTHTALCVACVCPQPPRLICLTVFPAACCLSALCCVTHAHPPTGAVP